MYESPKTGSLEIKGAYKGSTPARRCYVGGTLVYQGFGPASEQEFVQQEATGGPAKLLKVYGKSIVNNQLVDTPHLTGTSTASWQEIHFTQFPVTTAHKYALLLANWTNLSIRVRYPYISGTITANSIITPTADGNLGLQYIGPAGSYGAVDTYVYIIDLTLLYGAGNEPTSVAQFEADYPTYNPAYNPGEVQNNATTELRAYDGGNLRGSLALNLSTLTGKLNGEGASVVVYPDGWRGVGTDRDTAYGSTGVVRLGKRAYQAGDESDTSVLTDGTNTIYPLATPLTYTLDTPLPTDLTCEQGDILQRVSDNNCPFVGEMRFGL